MVMPPSPPSCLEDDVWLVMAATAAAEKPKVKSSFLEVEIAQKCHVSKGPRRRSSGGFFYKFFFLFSVSSLKRQHFIPTTSTVDFH